MDRSEAEERRLWNLYRASGDPVAHQQLFFLYVSWARVVARDVYRRVRVPQMDWADYAQNATMGLLEAMSRFDIERGIDFKTYAKYRVRGAVFNGLRCFLADARSHAGDRWADRVASFDPPDADDDPLDQLIGAVTGLGIGYLLDAGAAGDQLMTHADASAIAERDQIDGLVSGSVVGLPERERLVVTLHYEQHLPFVDIARMLGVTKGRISQIHKSAMDRLRSQLRSTAQLHQIA